MILSNGTPPPSERLTSFTPVSYEGATTRLWTDREYRTSTDVERLGGTTFLRIPRNEDRPILFRVARPTVVYLLANRSALSQLPGWSVLPDTVFVADVYPPRRMDVLLSRTVKEGHFVLKGPSGGPSHPLFYRVQDVIPLP
jgi:hypothetical protein